VKKKVNLLLLFVISKYKLIIWSSIFRDDK